MSHPVHVTSTTTIKQSFRVAAIQGMFDVPLKESHTFTMDAEIPAESESWQIGLIVGASGSGKTSLARQAYGAQIVSGYADWDGRAIVDHFPAHLSVQEVVDALSAVGFSSPPHWVLPFHALSNGQQFRVTLARALAEHDFLVYDEFTSVVDRTVAKSVCVSVGKYLRRTGKRAVFVSCHFDIIEWLQPDWTFSTENTRLSRDCLCRPNIEVRILSGSVSDWRLFHPFHYMTANLSPSARIYLAYALIDGYYNLVGFFSTMPAMGMTGWVRGHRTVVLPDYQGLGVGNRMIEAVAEYLWNSARRRFRATTAAPGIIKHRLRNPDMWRMVEGPTMKAPSANKNIKVKTSAGRLTTTWEYIPQALRK